MKIIRVTDDNFIIDLGPDATSEVVEFVKQNWSKWWDGARWNLPGDAFIVGRLSEPFTYEDRRETDLDTRLNAIEKRLDIIIKELDWRILPEEVNHDDRSGSVEGSESRGVAQPHQ